MTTSFTSTPRTQRSRLVARGGRALLSTLAISAIAAIATLSAGPLSVGSPTRASDLTFKSGQTWRGAINDTVEVVFTESGRERTLEGTVVRADRTMIVVETTAADGKTSRKTIFFNDVKSMRSLGSAPAKEAGETGATTTTAPNAASGTSGGSGAAADDADGKKPTPVAASDFKGVFYMPIEGTVGVGMRHDEIEAIGKEADKFGPGQIIIIEINSPGGLVLESERIHATMLDLKKRHRVVAWIKEAISAAAFTALHCDEIYFMNVGALGSMTMFAGTQSAKGESLAGWLDLAGRVAKEGGRNPHIARCMIKIELELSYDIPEGGGPKDAIFREDAKGQFVLDRADTMLTLNAAQALACGFSDGTADTVEELAVVMGLPMWKEVNEVGRKIHRDWQRTLKEGTHELTMLMNQYEYKNTTSGDPEKIISTRIRIINDVLRWVDRCWSCAFEVMGGLPEQIKPALERELEELRRQLAEIKQAQRQQNRPR
jgi:hypothetical protein